jgi:uncharacterized protein DUF6968
MPNANERKKADAGKRRQAAVARAHASPVIASRHLTRNDEGKTRPVTIRVRRPVRTADVEVCAFEVTGLLEPYRDYAYGVDSMQALLLAMSAITKALQPHRADLSWLGEAGWDGMPMAITFDDDLNAQLRADIEAAIRRHERRIARFNAAKAREHGIDLKAFLRKPPPKDRRRK